MIPDGSAYISLKAKLRGSERVMGIRVMRLVTLWLVVSTQSFRAHGFAINSAKGVQGGHKRGRDSTEVAQGDVKDVCRVGDSPATCQDLSAKYRGGGAYIG